jgi:hypothetical protein
MPLGSNAIRCAWSEALPLVGRGDEVVVRGVVDVLREVVVVLLGVEVAVARGLDEPSSLTTAQMPTPTRTTTKTMAPTMSQRRPPPPPP